MKVHKVTLLVVDHDRLGAEQIKMVLEHANYPNDCMNPTVVTAETVDIGEWRDDHPLNIRPKMNAEFNRLFNHKGIKFPGANEESIEKFKERMLTKDSIEELADMAARSIMDWAHTDTEVKKMVIEHWDVENEDEWVCIEEIVERLLDMIKDLQKSPASLGVAIGRVDMNGDTIHIGDTLEFDAEEYGAPCEFVIELTDGEIQHPGASSDLTNWCTIIKKWDKD